MWCLLHLLQFPPTCSDSPHTPSLWRQGQHWHSAFWPEGTSCDFLPLPTSLPVYLSVDPRSPSLSIVGVRLSLLSRQTVYWSGKRFQGEAGEGGDLQFNTGLMIWSNTAEGFICVCVKGGSGYALVTTEGLYVCRFCVCLCGVKWYWWRARRGNLSAVPAVMGTTGRQTEREIETDIACVGFVYLGDHTVYACLWLW